MERSTYFKILWSGTNEQWKQEVTIFIAVNFICCFIGLYVGFCLHWILFLDHHMLEQRTPDNEIKL